jgi:L-amino acid N-acyltransferase YncA
MPLTLRMATQADVPVLAAIAKACVVQTPTMYNLTPTEAQAEREDILADYLHLAIKAKGGGGARVVVAEQAGTILGFVRLNRAGSIYELGARACIREVCVHPTHQRQGIGTALLQTALRLAVAEEWWPILGEVHRTQPPHVVAINKRVGLCLKANSLNGYHIMISTKRPPKKVLAYPMPAGWQPWQTLWQSSRAA